MLGLCGCKHSRLDRSVDALLIARFVFREGYQRIWHVDGTTTA